MTPLAYRCRSKSFKIRQPWYTWRAAELHSGASSQLTPTLPIPTENPLTSRNIGETTIASSPTLRGSLACSVQRSIIAAAPVSVRDHASGSSGSGVSRYNTTLLPTCTGRPSRSQRSGAPFTHTGVEHKMSSSVIMCPLCPSHLNHNLPFFALRTHIHTSHHTKPTPHNDRARAPLTQRLRRSSPPRIARGCPDGLAVSFLRVQGARRRPGLCMSRAHVRGAPVNHPAHTTGSCSAAGISRRVGTRGRRVRPATCDRAPSPRLRIRSHPDGATNTFRALTRHAGDGVERFPVPLRTKARLPV